MSGVGAWVPGTTAPASTTPAPESTATALVNMSYTGPLPPEAVESREMETALDYLDGGIRQFEGEGASGIRQWDPNSAPTTAAEVSNSTDGGCTS